MPDSPRIRIESSERSAEVISSRRRARALEAEEVLERRRAPRVGGVRERLAEARAIALAARALIEERADEERGRHEELDVGLLDVLSSGRARRRRGRREARSASVPGRWSGAASAARMPSDADARRRAERASTSQVTHSPVSSARWMIVLLISSRSSGPSVLPLPRALMVRGVPDSSTTSTSPRSAPMMLDEDVEAVVEHGVALEHAEDALEQDAHRAPHRLGVEGGPRREARRTSDERIACATSQGRAVLGTESRYGAARALVIRAAQSTPRARACEPGASPSLRETTVQAAHARRCVVAWRCE